MNNPHCAMADFSNSANGKPKVVVCVVTYLRSEGLKRLLEGLNGLTFEKSEPPDLEVIVVDNDPAGSAREFCERIRSGLDWPLRYFVEPRRGIPFARNTSVAHAREAGAEFLAFIDDDEVPEPSWLEELLEGQRACDADVVTGPHEAHFLDDVPRWIAKGGFHDSPRHPSGQRMEWASTANALVREPLLRSWLYGPTENPFDERLAFSGGSDGVFFARCVREGYRIVWWDDALVREWIPPSRANMRWILQRRYRIANNRALRMLMFDPPIATRVALMAKAWKSVTKGLRTLPPRPVALKARPWEKLRKRRSPVKLVQRERLTRALRHVSWGLGLLAGVAGKRYQEYRRHHVV